MRKILILLPVAFLLLTIPSFAQDKFAPFEVFGGYSFVRIDGDDDWWGGWNTAVTTNFNSSFGIKTEISGAYKSYKDNYGDDYKISGYSFMAGPQIRKRFELYPGASYVFGHALPLIRYE